MSLYGGAFQPYATGIQPGENVRESPEMKLLALSQGRARLAQHRRVTQQQYVGTGVLLVAAITVVSLDLLDAVQVILIMAAIMAGALALGREVKENTLRDQVDSAEREHLAAELTRTQRDLAQAQDAAQDTKAEPEPEQAEPLPDADPEPPGTAGTDARRLGCVAPDPFKELIQLVLTGHECTEVSE